MKDSATARGTEFVQKDATKFKRSVLPAPIQKALPARATSQQLYLHSFILEVTWREKAFG